MTTGRDCRRHGYYLNVNGCPDCNARSIDKVITLINKLNRKG